MNPHIPSLNHSLIVNEEIINYKLRYSSKAKYLRIQIVHGQELEVILPRGCQLSEAEQFIIKKAKWIKKHLNGKKDGDEKFLFLGEEVTVIQEHDFFIKKHRLTYEKKILKVESPAGSNISKKRIYDHWLRQQAKLYLKKRAAELAFALQFSINKISIKGQKTRWGSCSSKKNLSFNFKLMQFRREIIDYVIIHELCHLKEMNHSKEFWALVERFCPGYKSLRKELNHGKTI